MRIRLWMRMAALLVLGATALGVQAEEHGHYGRGAEHVDARFAHNRSYPARGNYVREVPGRPMVVERGGGRFFYSGGVWYAPRGPRFVVIGAPIGVFVPVLPPFYTTVWFGGVPYYYANDTYYVWHDGQNGYEVVDPPGSEQSASTEAPPSDDLFIYPQKDQSPDQQANDKYECHKWASAQSGFDPTQSAGGVAPEQLAGKRGDYQRAMRACLEGRGYSVR
ncbi:MAG TPA: DUF6515 family protein [Candidatus Dormibacteraeota bacterium]|nr:DUF6515 family protein [Candidatus Dormibacteraeota bacterium]